MFVAGDLTPLSRKCLISASGETRGLSDLRGDGVSQQSRGGMCEADLEPLQSQQNSNFKGGECSRGDGRRLGELDASDGFGK